MTDAARADLRAWLIAACSGLAIDLAHSVAWRAFLGRAFGDLYLALVVVLFAASPVVVSFVGAKRLFALGCARRRGVRVFLALLLVLGLQALYLEALFPRILPVIAIEGRGLGVVLSPLGFALGAWLGCRRSTAPSARRGDSDGATTSAAESPSAIHSASSST